MYRSQPSPAAANRSPFSLSDSGLLVLLALGNVLLQALLNGQYGFHRDELDILMNARQLAWGYVAYPPLTPLIARIGLELFGASLIGLRLFPALAQGVVTLLVGLMARDLGAKRLGQVVAAVAVAIAPVALTAGMLIQYMSFDYLWWVAVAFFTVRLLKTDNPRWWLGIGASIGLGMMTKYTIAFLVLGLVAGVVLTPARRYLRSPWLWAGALVALAIFLPNLLWQVQHHFISLNFLSAIHVRDISWGRTKSYWPDQLYVTTNPFTLPLWVAGLVYCLAAKPGQRFRLLGWMFLVTFAAMLYARGRSYYVAPAYTMLLTAGAVWLERGLDKLGGWLARGSRFAVGLVLVAGATLGILLVKPVAPIGSPLWQTTVSIGDNFVEMVGWPDLTEQVAGLYARLPEAEKPRTAILAGNYGEAGALDLYGPQYGLPPVISGANSFWERGYGSPAPETVIVVGFTGDYAGQYFKSCRLAGQVTNRYQVSNEETTHHTGLYICREPRKPWAEMWPTMQWFQ